jgi:DNA-binding IscR family transcriptional regulator
MSIKLMVAAWRANISASEKLSLLAMCDWANDDGGSLYPSIARLAERLSCSTRQAQRVLHRLIDAGWIAVVGNEHGGKPGAVRHYQINVQKLTDAVNIGQDTHVNSKTRVTPMSGVTPVSRVTSMAQTGDIHDRGRVTSMTQTGDTDVTLTIIEPPIEPSKEPSINNRARSNVRTSKPASAHACPDDVDEQVFGDWLEVRKAKRAGPVTQTVLDSMRREADKAGINLQDAIAHCCLSGWQGFRSDWYTSAKQSGGQQSAGSRPFFNRQIALEEENRRVAQEWLAQQRNKA